MAVGLALLLLPLGFNVDTAAAATFRVNSAGDEADAAPGDGICLDRNGFCTLRAALGEASRSIGWIGDSIEFGIGAGPKTIVVRSPLPHISGADRIDGTTQPGFVGKPIIQLQGDPLAPPQPGLRLVWSTGATIRGLVINRFRIGIWLEQATGAKIQGNYIGTDIAGTVAPSNGDGIYVGSLAGTSSDNLIGGTQPGDGNVISGNQVSGIYVHADRTKIQGNLIGTTANGTAALGNGTGIQIAGTQSLCWSDPVCESKPARDTLIGGASFGAGNVVSGNQLKGIYLYGKWSPGTRISNNLIGTDASGASALGNGQGPSPSAGIELFMSTDTVVGGGETLARNVISGNLGPGVRIIGGSQNVLAGNLIGLNKAGMTALGNTGPGVLIQGSTLNRIQRAAPPAPGIVALPNVIAGNMGAGIEISPASDENVVRNSWIGLSVYGLSIPNHAPGVIINSARNTIGGTSVDHRNVISGNGASGILISGQWATGNIVQGNHIGIDYAGTGARGNASGVSVKAHHNLIGGTAAGAGNLISHNRGEGVSVEGHWNSVQGNLVSGNGGDGVLVQGLFNGLQANTIGLDRMGGALPNSGSGVRLSSAGMNTIGGTAAAARNVISANVGNGVTVEGERSNVNEIKGNYIGTDPAGTAAHGNASGILIDRAHATNVGGAAAGAGNLISGNRGDGVLVKAAESVTVRGNSIGLDSAGGVLPNARAGISLLDAPRNTIGDGSPAGRNVISGNGGAGLTLTGLGARGNHVEGNYIGLNVAGDSALGNGADGVFIDGAPDTTVGGSAPGAGNVLSGNRGAGLRIAGVGAAGNRVLGNKIGTGEDDALAIGNEAGALVMADGNTIGPANVISGNRTHGVAIGASRNAVLGNTIGTDGTGTRDLGNGGDGVLVSAATNPTISWQALAEHNVIGGVLPADSNLISGNDAFGVRLFGERARTNRVQRNSVGTDLSGTAPIGNSHGGIAVISAPNNLVIGNLVSGNAATGVRIERPEASGNQVKGNLIGTDAAGTAALGNAAAGVGIQDAANNVVGGVGADSANVISSNAIGVATVGNAIDNRVEGNFIGTDASGATALGNATHGVILVGGERTTVGGTSTGAGNTIAFNGAAGIAVQAGRAHAIRGNSIFSNGWLGIDLLADGVTPNDWADADVGPNDLQNFPESVAAIASYTGALVIDVSLSGSVQADLDLDFYASDSCDPSGFGEGAIFLGSTAVMTDKNGDASAAVTFPDPGGARFVTVTASGLEGTSEFSSCVEAREGKG